MTLNSEALEKACEAFAESEIKYGRQPKFSWDSIAAAILVYQKENLRHIEEPFERYAGKD